MNDNETTDFVAYEYLTKNVLEEKENLYIDCYQNFGWLYLSKPRNGLVDKSDYYINNQNNLHKTTKLQFKRNRNIPNKVKIELLQEKCDNSLTALIKLEKQPSSKGSFYATMNAIIGAIFMAISVFAITDLTPNFILIIGAGFIGLILWFLSYPIYKKTKDKQLKINKPIIEEHYNTIYNSCEQANKLLRK